MMQHFINCDWGTTHFRLRLVHVSNGAIVCQRSSDEGAAQLAAAAPPASRGRQYQEVLERHVSELLTGVDADLQETPILISGMASSSIGWRELPYAPLPFALDGRDLHWQRIEEPGNGTRRPVYLLSGVRSQRDVMRGEEVELLGLSLFAPELCEFERALVLLPGTHSKHVWLSRDKIVDFQTHMTGELFDLLSKRSSLRHPHDAPPYANNHAAGCEAAFCEGVEQARQESLTSTLFQVRIRQVLQGGDAATCAALLSGILIGSELATLASQPEIRDTPMILCAGRSLSGNYQTALDVLGLNGTLRVIPPADVERLSALGQLAALQQIHPHATSGQTSLGSGVQPLDSASNGSSSKPPLAEN